MLSRYLALPNISLVFLTAVLMVAVRSSLGPSLACAGLSFLFYNFLFIPPTFTFIVARQEDVLTLLFFLLMAVLAGNLASRQRHQLQALRQAQAETTALLELSGRLSAATDMQAVCAVAVHQLQLLSDVEAVVATRTKKAEWSFKGDVLPVLSDLEQAAAEWSWKHGQAAGQGTDTCLAASGGGCHSPAMGNRWACLVFGRPLGNSYRRPRVDSLPLWPNPWRKRWAAQHLPMNLRRPGCTGKPRSCAALCWRPFRMTCVHR